jgi:ribosomal RNA assembly protein
MNSIFIKIPKIRVGALIGKNGETKKELEELSDSKIYVDGEGEIEISTEKANAVTFYKLENVIKAIGRGFNPEKAKLLLDEYYTLNVINLQELGVTTERGAHNRKARIIGAQGSIRSYLEKQLDCFISVQGKTISIIGRLSNIRICHEAIMRIINGASIGAVKHFIEKLSKNLETQEEFEFNENKKEEDILD